MIQKLRVKFITASMLSLALVLLVILGGVNAMSYQKVVRDADRILALLSENRRRRDRRAGASGARYPTAGRRSGRAAAGADY